jgi:hypothetical protein
MKFLCASSALLCFSAFASSVSDLNEPILAALVLILPTLALYLRELINARVEELKHESRQTRALILSQQRRHPARASDNPSQPPQEPTE